MEKVISDFILDLSDLPSTSVLRKFSVTGSVGSQFTLEIRDKDTGKYYNFVTNTFQTNSTKLEETIKNRAYNGVIKFPAVTGDDDQYDIYLYAMPGTKHAPYLEVRFGDDSIDVNSSKGSNSLMMQKVAYQYADKVTLTLTTLSPNSTVETGSQVNTEIELPRGKSKGVYPFEISCSVSTATKVYKLKKQPTQKDVLAFIRPLVGDTESSLGVGSTPIDLPGENIYPTRRTAFAGNTVNGAVTSGAVVRMDATDLSAVIAEGDKITLEATTDTVNGDFSGGATAITMDSAVATKMAVGDQVTGTRVLDAGIFTVASIDSTPLLL